MSYLKKRYARKRKRTSVLGDVTSTIEGLFSGISSSAGTALAVSQDPYLPETVCRIEQLKAIKNSQTPGGCNKTQMGLPGGVGLSNAIIPLRGYVYAQQNKWVYVVGIAAVLGLPWYLGFSMGKADR